MSFFHFSKRERMRTVAEDKENASRRGGGLAASTSYLLEKDNVGQQHAPAAAGFAHKSTRFAPRDVKVRRIHLAARVTFLSSLSLTHSLPVFLSSSSSKTQKQCLVSYTAGAADAAKLASKGGRSKGGDANTSVVNCASAAASEAPLDVDDVDDAGRRRRRHPAAETTPAPPLRRVEWEAEEELETPLTQQQQRSRKNDASESPLACFVLDLFSWRDSPLSLLALSAVSAALFFALSGSSPLHSTWAFVSPPVSYLRSALFERPLATLLCHLALFDLGVNSLRGLLSEKLRQRGDLSGSVVEAAAASAAASAVRGLCSLRDAALNPKNPKTALRTAAALLLLAGSNLGGGSGGSSVVTVGVLGEVSKVSAVSGFYLCFAAGAAWRWWPRTKRTSSSSSSSRRPLPPLRPNDLSVAASLAARKLSNSLALLSEKTKLAALAQLFAELSASSSLGTRVALGSLAACVAWRLSAWGTRGAALLLLLLFARAHLFGDKLSKELTRRAMRHPVLASARKGCAALGSAARERVTMRGRRRREEEEEEEFFEEEEDRGRGRAAAGASATDLYSSRLQAAVNDARQQRQQQFPHSSRPAFRRGGGAIR